jgi:RNA polymerase sigma-70 factor (ECF subfamily)
VLGWHADEVAATLHTSVTAVHSMLRRARRVMAERDTSPDTGRALGEVEWSLVARYVDAFQRFDVDALVALLRDDATLSMPPIPGWVHGKAEIERFWFTWGWACRGSRVLPTSANGLPAFGSYRPAVDGSYRPFAIQVIDVSHDGITAMHAFIEPRLFPLFDLPDHFDPGVHGRP